MTNGDRIREMPDEELANFLLENVDCYSCTMHKPGCSIDCERSMLEWVREEANDG